LKYGLVGVAALLGAAVLVTGHAADARALKYPALDIAMPAAQGGPVLAAAELFKTVSPSIYVIVAAKNSEAMERGKSVYEGSAVAIAPNRALTNCHIVNKRKAIMLGQKKEMDLAVVIASDPKTDRCILETHKLKLHPIRGLRLYDDLTVGEKVYTIGNPSGLEATLGEGIVSGLRRYDGVRYVQTSAPISPGSSGGGLFDERGNLLGITSFNILDAQNLNFAIAAEDYWSRIKATKKRKSGSRSGGSGTG
jgi:serine protease Do